MAVELAQALVHEVVVDDSKAVAGAQRAANAMDSMAASSDKATAASTRQVSGLRLLDEATVKLSRAQESAWGALQKWKAVADDNERAMQRLARAEADLNRAVRQGVATEEEKIRVLDQLRQKLSGYAVANDNAVASTGRFKGALGNLGLQLQDVTVQAQMGTSAFIILAQQGPQIASAFGPAGIAIGTVVAIASVAAGVLFTLGDETKKSAKEIDTFGDVLGIFEGRARESGAAIDTLTDSYRALGGELRALSKLALQADIATLTEKRAKDQKSAWDAIRNATMSGAQDVPAALGALQQLGQDKDIAAFLGKLQTLNEKGAIKLMRDEDIRALLETGEALRVAEARMADLEGRATPAQKALLGYADAAREAARATREAADAAYEASRAQGLALGSVIVQERDLDRKIAALKGGEAAMKAYGEEQIRATTYDKAFKSNLAAGESLLDARTEATRIATKAVEAYRLEQQRADDQKANTKAESQAERDAKAYAKVTEELDRGIAEQQRLAGVVGQSVAAQREANTQTKIAEALSKAHTTASTAEGKAIAGKVRDQERWRAAAADAAVLDSSKRQLAYAEKELSLMGQAEPLRARALQSFQIQQEAQEKLKTTTPELVAQWVQYQEQIADTQAIKAFQLEIQGAAKEMSRDITQTLLDREAKWSDLGKTIGKRIALGMIEANIVLPFTTAVVGAMPGLFGIQGPATAANQNAANQNGAAGLTGQASSMATNWGAGKALSWAGDKLGITGGFDALMNTPVWGTSAIPASTFTAGYVPVGGMSAGGSVYMPSMTVQQMQQGQSCRGQRWHHGFPDWGCRHSGRSGGHARRRAGHGGGRLCGGLPDRRLGGHLDQQQGGRGRGRGGCRGGGRCRHGDMGVSGRRHRNRCADRRRRRRAGRADRHAKGHGRPELARQRRRQRWSLRRRAVRGGQWWRRHRGPAGHGADCRGLQRHGGRLRSESAGRHLWPLYRRRQGEGQRRQDARGTDPAACRLPLG
ncbi:phage tail length tape measure family protein [Azospirillum aestuarii]|uniref:phage tail length tape measure family protein n=1 Tax=Azospirillum aestuarii TaxID=2802052 RepID=UPI004054E9A3